MKAHGSRNVSAISVRHVVDVAGGSQRLVEEFAGRGIAITVQAISRWKRTNVVPVARVPILSKLTGVPPHMFRPDIYEEAA